MEMLAILLLSYSCITSVCNSWGIKSKRIKPGWLF